VQYDVFTIGGQPYPTRNNPALSDSIRVSTTRDLLDIPDADYQTVLAIHEAGHAIATLAGGRAHLVSLSLSDNFLDETGGVVHAYSYDLHGTAQLITHCAGERAVDMWLHRHGLWTTRRAAAAEIGARSDRALALAVPGMTHALLRGMHDPTDDLLDAHWAKVEVVADAALGAGHLTGSQVAAITGLANQFRPEAPLDKH
jgi:hypothetical protein